jgi:F-type H+-transporting ATPase subunit alpha
VPVEKIRDFEFALYDYLDANYEKLLETIADKKELDEEIEKGMSKAIEEFKGSIEYLI